jgi:CHAT domain-containing protein/Tfp pilus assembly protein PilF
MKLCRFLLLIFVSLLHAPAALGQSMSHPDTGLKPGVVVESVEAGFAAAEAGIQEGDVLLSWTCGSGGGAIQSPFDLWELETEQRPLGPVTIHGLRGAESHSWVPGADSWSLTARPNFADPLLRLYRDGLRLATSNRLVTASERWRAITGRAPAIQRRWLSTWLVFRAAGSLAERREWQKSDGLYERAIKQATALKRSTAISLADRSLAPYWNASRSDWSKAENRVRQLGMDPNETENLSKARYLLLLGFVASHRNDLDRAEEYLQHSLAIQTQLAPSGSVGAVSALRYLFIVSWLRSDLTRAEDWAIRARTMQEELGPNSFDLGNIFTYFNVLAWQRGDLDNAQQYLRLAWKIVERFQGDPLRESTVSGALVGFGVLERERGNFAAAEGYYKRALVIEQRHDPNGPHFANVLVNLGDLASCRGDYALAETYLRRGLAILRKTSPESRYVAEALREIGSTLREQGASAGAENYFTRALALQDKLSPGGSIAGSEILNELGITFQLRHEVAKAERYYRQSLAVRKRIAPGGLDETRSLQSLAEILQLKGEVGQAEESYRQALAIRERLAPGSILHATTLAALAGIMVRKQQWDEAAKLYEQAINASESQSARLGGREEVRSGFRARVESYYKDYADLLIAQKQQEHAFEVVERARARTLLETLAIAQVDVRKGADPALIEQERSLQQKLTDKSNYRIRLLEENHAGEQIKAVDKDIADLLLQIQDIEGQLRSSSPAYAALTQPQPLTAKQVQQQLLDDGTVLLEYSLGQERSHLFAVTSTTLNSYELPKRAEIENQARLVYSLLTARDHKFVGETLAQKEARLRAALRQYEKAAAELSRILLSPVAQEIAGKRLLIVSDGALAYVPFATLPSPQGSGTHPEPLMVGHEIVNLPSASVLAVLRQQDAGRAPASKAVAVLADPVFVKDDPRISLSRERSGPPLSRATNTKNSSAGRPQGDSWSFAADLLVRSAGDVGLKQRGQLYLNRLPFTRREAEAIMAVTPKDQAMQALDFRASRATAMSAELGQYRIVHFATHGLLDSRHPELSGLVLSLVDHGGKAQNGFLELQDIYNLNLSADLVVLSACETGLGKEVEGEGLVGLTRGFMYAGASRVVASLWKVSDEATAKLMGEFYRGMEQEGMRPAAALRAAQILLWKQRQWSDPYYWAAFQIQGEWK